MVLWMVMRQVLIVVVHVLLVRILRLPTNVPSPISTNVLIAGGLTLAMIGLFLYAFRKQLEKFFGTFKKKKKAKLILLKDAQKERLLQEIYILQSRLDEKNMVISYAGIGLFLRNYFKEVLGIEHLSKENLLKGLGNFKEKGLVKILFDFYSRLAPLEGHKGGENSIELQTILDMMLQHIYFVSEFTEKDAIVCVKERSLDTTDALDLGYLKLSNIYIALEFTELGAAKRLYTELLSLYDTMLVLEKQHIFYDILLVYYMIMYVDVQEQV